MRVLITGDRSMPLITAVPVAAVQLLKVFAADPSTQVVVGDTIGVEQAVQIALTAADVPEDRVSRFEYEIGTDSRPAFAHAYASLDAIDRVIVIHGDLGASRIYRAAVEVFGDDKVETVSPGLVFV